MDYICPSCRTSVPAGIQGMRLNCSHWVHTRCLRKQANPDFEKCEACKGLVDMNVPVVSLDEPTSLDGHDYVAEPIASNSRSLLPSFVLGKNKEPFSLLAERKPLDWVIREKGWGLQKMLKAGVRIEDFLKNGYEWKDLKAFRDLSSGGGRSLQALFALGCNAEHFRDFLGEAIPDLGITGRHLVEVFGFVFPKGKGLCVTGGKNDRAWVASDLIPLGMKMDDLFGAGMEWIEQYEDLQASQEEEKALEVRGEHFGYLTEPVIRDHQFRMEPSTREASAKSSSVQSTKGRYIEPVAMIPRRLHGLKQKK